MTVIESTVEVNKPVAEVYAFLSNMNNHQQLMPENIYNWESTEDDARFTIQNMAKLAIKISNRVENQEITAIPSEKAPFDVELKWTVADNGNGTTTAKHIISADLKHDDENAGIWSFAKTGRSSDRKTERNLRIKK